MNTIKRMLVVLPVVFAIICSGCTDNHSRNVITQASTIDAILAGSYGGFITVDQLYQYGDNGIGTFDSLNGEMAVIDGTAYQVTGDGMVHLVGGAATSPFASMVWFDPDIEFYVISGDFEQLSRLIEMSINSANTPAAIRIDGEFAYMHTRSVPAQKKPYPKLVEVVKNQPEFTSQNIKGKIVGFWLPDFVSRINVPGYHLHFIADDGSMGGHILDLKIKRVKVAIDLCDQINVKLPISSEEFIKTDLKTDRTEDLQKSER